MSASGPVPSAADENLSDVEQQMLTAAISGALLHVLTGDASDDDPAQGERWGTSRQIRATLLAELLTGRRSGDKAARAVRLRGARITGPLDLEASTITCPLLLWDCYLDEPVSLDEATAPSIRMPGCYLPTLTATQLRTTGDLQLSGAKFIADDEVDLSGAHVGGQLILDGVSLSNTSGPALTANGLTVDQGMFCRDQFTAEGEVCLAGARIGLQLNMSDARLANPDGPALTADSLTVNGDMFCRGLSTAAGEVRLIGAHIGGQLVMSSAKLTNPSGPALNAGGLTVGLDMLCADKFTATGEVRLPGAHIGGQLVMSRATLNSMSGPALTADSLTVGLDMLCADKFTATGEVRVPGAHISGQLDMGSAILNSNDGSALNAQRLTLGGSLFCHEGFTATGEIGLAGAHIGGQLVMSSATLNSMSGPALTADSLTVGLDMLCADKFTATGEVRLPSAHISGRLDMSSATLNSNDGSALNAQRLTVGEDMLCADKFTATGEMDLFGAHIGGQLDMSSATLNNPGSFALHLEGAVVAELVLRPQQRLDGVVVLTDARVGKFHDDPASWPAVLRLDGFDYGLLGTEGISTRRRLQWLRLHQDGYAPQLYDQLASTYRRAGDEQAAREVAIAKQRRGRHAFSPLSWLWYLTVGYGYRPWLAGAWVIALTALGTAVFSSAYPAHMIATSPHPPTFHAAGYALDLLLPVINLGQKSAWQPRGPAYQYWSWAFTGVGWVLATAFVAGLAGILKRD